MYLICWFDLLCPCGEKPPKEVGESRAKLERGLDLESSSHTTGNCEREWERETGTSGRWATVTPQHPVAIMGNCVFLNSCQNKLGRKTMAWCLWQQLAANSPYVCFVSFWSFLTAGSAYFLVSSKIKSIDYKMLTVSTLDWMEVG